MKRVTLLVMLVMFCVCALGCANSIYEESITVSKALQEDDNNSKTNNDVTVAPQEKANGTVNSESQNTPLSGPQEDSDISHNENKKEESITRVSLDGIHVHTFPTGRDFDQCFRPMSALPSHNVFINEYKDIPDDVECGFIIFPSFRQNDYLDVLKQLGLEVYDFNLVPGTVYYSVIATKAEIREIFEGSNSTTRYGGQFCVVRVATAAAFPGLEYSTEK